MAENNEPKTIVYGSNYDIHDNTLNFYGGKHFWGKEATEGEEEKPKRDINDYSIGELREQVNKVMPMVGEKYSRFFSVIKVMMWRGRIPDHDFEKGVALVNELYPGWNMGKTEQYAIAKYDVGCFYKSFDKWKDDADAPVHGNTFKVYYNIAQELLKLL